MKTTVCVVGSMNMDLTVTAKKMPMQGETTFGEGFGTYPGGKGANQAVAAARLGAKVNMIGAVGGDDFGETLRNNLVREGICIDGVQTIQHATTGVANIILTENDNRIIVASGANQLITPELVQQHRNLIEDSDILLLQLEIPLTTISYVIDIAEACNVPVIINPAPYQELPDEILEKVMYLTPNEVEADSILKHTNASESKIITTRGDKGVQFFEDNMKKYLPSHSVDVVDTTGAGDTFNGALTVKLGCGEKISDAVIFANAAAALSVTKIGAQGGMPTINEVEEFLQRGK